MISFFEILSKFCRYRGIDVPEFIWHCHLHLAFQEIIRNCYKLSGNAIKLSSIVRKYMALSETLCRCKNYLAMFETVWHCPKLYDSWQKLIGIARKLSVIVRNELALLETI